MAVRIFKKGHVPLLLALAASTLAFTLPASIHAAEPPPPLAAYGDLPAVEQMAMSPIGAGLAVVARAKGERRVLVFDGQKQLRASLPLGEAKVRDLRWTDEGHVCVIMSATNVLSIDYNVDKAELSYAAIIPLDGGKTKFVFGNSPAMAHAIFGDYGVRTVTGKSLAYFGGIALTPTADRFRFEFLGGRAGLYSIDVATMDVHRLANPPGEGHNRDWVLDGQGNVTAILELYRDPGTWTVTAGNGAELARGTERNGHIELVGLGRDGASAVLSKRDTSDGEIHWYEVPLSGGPMAEVLKDILVERVFIDPTNGRMIGYLPENGDNAGVPVLFDPERQERLRKVYRAFPNRVIRIEAFTPDLGHVLVRTSGNADPGSWFVIDVVNRKADPVGDERPAIASGQVGAISTVTYHAADGLEVSGILTLPPGRDPHMLPVVLLPHGGPDMHNVAAFDGGRRRWLRAAMRCSSPISAVRPIATMHSSVPATGSGAARY